MKKPMTLYGAAVAVAVVFSSHPSFAFDLNGAWANNASACGKIFVKTNNTVTMKADADMFGDGFIVRGNAIVGNSVACTVKTRKQVGPLTHLVAACAADKVAFSTFQLSYRVENDNTIVRVFPGIEELNIKYSRCTL